MVAVTSIPTSVITMRGVDMIRILLACFAIFVVSSDARANGFVCRGGSGSTIEVEAQEQCGFCVTSQSCSQCCAFFTGSFTGPAYNGCINGATNNCKRKPRRYCGGGSQPLPIMSSSVGEDGERTTQVAVYCLIPEEFAALEPALTHEK